MAKAIVANQKRWTFGELAKSSWKHGSFLYIFIAMFLFYVIVNIQYINWGSITNILTHTAVVGTVALGMGLIIISGDIDLSVGANFAFSGGLGILAYKEVLAKTNHGVATLVTIIIIIVLAAVIGFINGFMVGKLKMPAFIATLGTMLIFRSLCKYILKAIPTEGGQQQQTYQLIDYYNSPFYEIGNGSIPGIGIPFVGLILIALVLIVYYFAKHTKFGRKIYALGSNAKAASLAGINVPWTKVIIFTLAGALVGVAAVLHVSIYSSMDSSTAGQSYELYAIASCVIGGIAMSGGRGNIIGILFGSLSFQIIDKIISALRLNPLINDTIKGSILLVAVILQVIVFDRAAFVKFLQKTKLIYNPEQEFLLEAEHRKKVNSVKLAYDKKFKKVLDNKVITKEEADVLINGLLDQREAIIVALNKKYELKIDNAHLKALEYKRIQNIKDEIRQGKGVIKKAKLNASYALKNAKKQYGPCLKNILEVEIENAKSIYEKKIEVYHRIDALSNDVSVLLDNAKHVYERDIKLDGTDVEKAKVIYETKINKINNDLEVRKSLQAKRDNNLKEELECMISKCNSLIENNRSKEEEQVKLNEERLLILKEKQAIKDARKAQKEAEKKAKIDAKKAAIDQEKQEAAKRVAYLESVMKKRNMR